MTFIFPDGHREELNLKGTPDSIVQLVITPPAWEDDIAPTAPTMHEVLTFNKVSRFDGSIVYLSVAFELRMIEIQYLVQHDDGVADAALDRAAGDHVLLDKRWLTRTDHLTGVVRHVREWLIGVKP